MCKSMLHTCVCVMEMMSHKPIDRQTADVRMWHTSCFVVISVWRPRHNHGRDHVFFNYIHKQRKSTSVRKLSLFFGRRRFFVHRRNWIWQIRKLVAVFFLNSKWKRNDLNWTKSSVIPWRIGVIIDGDCGLNTTFWPILVASLCIFFSLNFWWFNRNCRIWFIDCLKLPPG